ncbi:phytoene desaturase family protein [Aureispira sp. CCB-E]|uniref:phytoene desaturase family protein n=1 Tax=Aureispira sp. CCB-E TaxID=3051121 RepID=UPI00286944BC|nr:phytoene desaturase family protein [Aureispira sp. CCB-E]WMX14567.1 phytoene desaturase family protein [Aureispira sp. CCB-E]
MQIDIIGSGFAGLVAACFLAKNGHEVHVHEKNEMVGGRARTFSVEGFTFDMGPSWYWMPDLIDKIFEDLGEKREDYITLERLDPSYRVFWNDRSYTDMPASMDALYRVFDDLEKDGGKKLKQFLDDAQIKYKVGTEKFLEKPGLSLLELIDVEVFKNFFKLDLFKSVEKDVCNRFESHKARSILRFPVLFLGEMPHRIPSLYTLMNYADLKLGTWYPKGGMQQLAQGLKKIAEKHGAVFHLNSPVTSFTCANGKVTDLHFEGVSKKVEQVVAGADYNFVEQQLIPKAYRRYSPEYWDKRKMAPSSLIYYLGVNKKLEGVEHHNLFFDEDLVEHGKQIYDQPDWPDSPLFYACVTSKTDPDVAPEGKENVFLLMPLAPDVEDNETLREKYLDIMLERMERHTGQSIRSHIIYKRSYCINDFKQDYNSYKGNAYGLANTLMQTANLKPKITSKLDNLVFCGQLTVPGPGVPPALISGKVAAKLVMKKAATLKKGH